MTRYTRVCLAPRGPFHFGGRGVGMEHSDIGLPADSLFSALCVAIAEAEGEQALVGLLDRFREARAPAEVPFRLTSLMPCAGEVYLLPYPMIGPPKVPGATDLRKRKLFKKLAWVSEAVFTRLACGETPADALDKNNAPITDLSERVWLTAGEQARLAPLAPPVMPGETPRPLLWKTGVRPRVTVDRVSSASNVYASGATEFNRSGDGGPAAGLYTTIEWLAADEAVVAIVRRAFERLGHSGIGGERSSGYGQFDPRFEELEAWPIGADGGGFFATLAPYHPRRAEAPALGQGARYEIVLRRGWLSLPGYQNLRRASVRMIADGSVLRWPDPEPLGELVDVTPKRLAERSGPAIYRYGLAFPVRIAEAAMMGGVP